MESRKLSDRIVEILEGKKARDIDVINIESVSILADYFIICNGTSTTHIKTLADELEMGLKQQGMDYLHKEGYNTARWILMDYGQVVVHIFHEQDRGVFITWKGSGRTES